SMDSQSNLGQLVDALGALGCFADLLHRRYEQSYEDGHRATAQKHNAAYHAENDPRGLATFSHAHLLGRPTSSVSRGRGQRRTLFPRPAELLDLPAELLHRVLDRPARAVGQAADRRPGHDADRLADLVEDVQVLDPPQAAADALGDLEHPGRTLAAG